MRNTILARLLLYWWIFTVCFMLIPHLAFAASCTVVSVTTDAYMFERIQPPGICFSSPAELIWQGEADQWTVVLVRVNTQEIPKDDYCDNGDLLAMKTEKWHDICRSYAVWQAEQKRRDLEERRKKQAVETILRRMRK